MVGENRGHLARIFPDDCNPLSTRGDMKRCPVTVTPLDFMKRWRKPMAWLGGLALSAAGAGTFTEDFSSDPAANGWRVFGDPNLFRWDSTNRNLRVTWDSSQTNSYFYRLLGDILTRDDDFQLGFDLTFSDYASGVTPGKSNSAPAAIGWLNLDQATQTNFLRGTGINSTYGPKNLVEFEFFPAFSSFLPTIAQVVVSTNNQWLYNHDNLQELTPGETFRVQMTYAAATHTLTTVVSKRAGQYGPTQTISVPPNRDFRVATIAICSYSDQNSRDSILAHGVVDNVTVTGPPSPVRNLSAAFSNGVWQTQFRSRSNWLYTLQRTADFVAWTNVANVTATTETNLILWDPNPPPGEAAYRVRAQRP